MSTTCERKGCHNLLAPPGRHRARKWCSDRCRKQASYGGVCDTCGGPTRYAGTTTPSATCATCALARQTIWSREKLIVEAFRWYRLVGAWPTSLDWSRSASSHHSASPAVAAARRAFRESTGPWPWTQDVQRWFGSWRAFAEAVDFPYLARVGNITRAERAATIAKFKAATP